MPCDHETAAALITYIAATYPDLEIAQVTTMPTATTPGTEVSGGNYARQVVDLGAWTADTVGGIAPTAAVTFPELVDSSYSAPVVAIEFYETSDHTTRRFYVPLVTPMSWVVGQTPTYPVGNLKLTVT